jgi:hypothetical protein
VLSAVAFHAKVDVGEDQGFLKQTHV